MNIEKPNIAAVDLTEDGTGIKTCLVKNIKKYSLYSAN